MLKEHPGVLSATLTDRNHTSGYSTSSIDMFNSKQMIETFVFKADNHFIPTLNIDLHSGRNFTEANINPSDNSIIVNEKFVSLMDFKDNPIGKSITIDGIKTNVIGVVKDYNFLPVKEKIHPMILYSNTQLGEGYNDLLVKYNPTNLDAVISAIKKGWKEMNTNYQLTFSFWDQELEKRYQSEERLSKVITCASIIAILISSLGLFGLTILLTVRRTSEIGVRKVNGAKIIEILAMLNGIYLKWIVLAFIVACPIAWYVMDLWLENFAYKTEINWWIFALAGVIALIIALVTVSWQSFRAASRNPVEALRYE
jgi:putative ABC transport system permease protein